MEDQSKRVKEEKNRLAIWFGLLAGLVYSMCLWGIDAVHLASAHAYYPWAKLAIGILPVVGLCILASWASNWLQSALLSMLIWFLSGLLICVFTCFISIKGITLVYRFFDPALAARVDYPLFEGVFARGAVAAVVCAILGAISGLFYGYLLDNANGSAAKIGTIMMFLIWGVFFAASASVMNSLVVRPMRGPVEAIDQLVEKKIIDETTPYSKIDARNMHLASLNPVVDLIHVQRRLVLATYDYTLVQTDVMINFDGQWVECIVIADQSSEPPVQQPVYCKKLE